MASPSLKCIILIKSAEELSREQAGGPVWVLFTLLGEDQRRRKTVHPEGGQTFSHSAFLIKNPRIRLVSKPSRTLAGAAAAIPTGSLAYLLPLAEGGELALAHPRTEPAAPACTLPSHRGSVQTPRKCGSVVSPVRPGTGNPLGRDFADEETIAGAANVLLPCWGVLNGLQREADAYEGDKKTEGQRRRAADKTPIIAHK